MLPSRQTIRAALFAVILPASLAPGAAAAPAPDSLAGDPGLGPSTAAPWNPPSPVPGSEPWEAALRSEEHTSELQSRLHLVCRLLLEKKKDTRTDNSAH